MLRFWSVTLQQLLLKFTILLLVTRVYPNYTLVLQHDSDYICKGYAVSFGDQTWQWTTCIAATTCWLGVPSQQKIPMNLVIVVLSMYILIIYIYIHVIIKIHIDSLSLIISHHHPKFQWFRTQIFRGLLLLQVILLHALPKGLVVTADAMGCHGMVEDRISPVWISLGYFNGMTAMN